MSKFCPKCGLENEEEAKFCKRCGSSLDAQVQSKSSRNVLIIVVVAILCVAAIAGTIIYLNADSDFNLFNTNEPIHIINTTFSTGNSLSSKTVCTINVGTEHADEEITVSVVYSRDGNNLNDGDKSIKTVGKDGNIVCESKDSFKKYPDMKFKDYIPIILGVLKDFKVIGQVLNTFLILEDGENLYMIDQHAAHERILFDKIVENVNKKEKAIQPLLVPFILNVNNIEYDFLLSKLETIKEFGIDIDEFGKNSFKISAIPIILENLDLTKFFNEILGDINSLKIITIKDALMEKLAQKACKSAIKSGDKLSDSEINALLELMKGNLALKCPHGRPVTVKITRNEIDKWFKRIV